VRGKDKKGNSYTIKLSLSSLILLVKAKIETAVRAMEHEIFLPPLTFSGIMPAKGKRSTWKTGIME
jgi:hypothetical protein